MRQEADCCTDRVTTAGKRLHSSENLSFSNELLGILSSKTMLLDPKHQAHNPRKGIFTAPRPSAMLHVSNGYGSSAFMV